MKKHLLLFTSVSFLFSSMLYAAIITPQSTLPPITINAAPPSFPTAIQAFKKIYTGELSITDAQTQPWFESYKALYTKISPLQSSDPAILTLMQVITLLEKIKQKTTTPETANVQFQAAQSALAASVTSVLSSY